MRNVALVVALLVSGTATAAPNLVVNGVHRRQHGLHVGLCLQPRG